jgi:hypothetical protein
MPRTVPPQIVALIDQNNIFDIKSPRFSVNHNTVAVLTAITRLIDEIPTELLTISGEDYTDLVCGVEAIRNAVTFWQQSTVGVETPGIGGKNALLLLRNALAKCPDQTSSAETAELVFITDVALRDSIRLDISTATSALHNEEWKAATVLAGAAAEALLLWAVTNAPSLANLAQKPKGSPEDWSLGNLIEVATALTRIKPNTSKQATLAQNFRNLIHPGRAQRLGEVCDRATALTALAAVELIVRDLN